MGKTCRKMQKNTHITHANIIKHRQTLQLTVQSSGRLAKEGLMRLRRVAVNVEIARRAGQRHFQPVQVFFQPNLAAEARICLQKWCHVQQVLFFFRRSIQSVQKLVVDHIDMAGGAGQGGLASTLHFYTVPKYIGIDYTLKVNW